MGQQKKSLATSIVNRIYEQVGVQRNLKHVINKITTIEKDYRTASDWLGATGSGVECKSSVKEYVMKLCPFYYDLQDVMEDRASTKPLYSRGCEIEREDKQESRREETSLNDITDRLFQSSDDDDDSDASMVHVARPSVEGDKKEKITPSGRKGSAKKRIKGVALPRSSSSLDSRSKEEDNEMTMMINLKRKQLNDEAESRKESFRFRQSEVESTIKLQAAQAEKVYAEARTARIIAKVTLMRERKKLIEDGFTQEEVNEALPLDM